MKGKYYYPYMKNTNLQMKNARAGRGMGSVLLGSTGSASSYENYNDYKETTGNGLGLGLGLGLGAKNKLNKKLESLSVAPKKNKLKNISFNL